MSSGCLCIYILNTCEYNQSVVLQGLMSVCFVCCMSQGGCSMLGPACQPSAGSPCQGNTCSLPDLALEQLHFICTGLSPRTSLADLRCRTRGELSLGWFSVSQAWVVCFCVFKLNPIHLNLIHCWIWGTFFQSEKNIQFFQPQLVHEYAEEAYIEEGIWQKVKGVQWQKAFSTSWNLLAY